MAPAAGRWHHAAAPLLGLCLGLLALGPGLRRGFLLSYDMVFVPSEPLSAALPGPAPPRAVPSDLAVVLASRVIPADITEKILLISVFVLACSGVAALLEAEPTLARLAAGVCYTWNPYVAERLIIGQWALLLGYAGLPWVLRAVLTTGPRQTSRLCLSMLPAIVGGFAAMTVTALVAVPVALLTKSARTAVRTAAVLAAGSLPWLIPSLLHPVSADPASVAAFAARPDTPFGTVGSLVMLGGIWNAQTVPAAYGGPWSALWLVITLAALTGYVSFAWRRGRREQRGGSRWPGLGVAAAVSLVIAGAGVTAAGREVLRAAIGVWPAFAVLRDGQQFVAPLALAEALGFGLIVAWAQKPRRQAANPGQPVFPGRQSRPGGPGHRRDRAPDAGTVATRPGVGSGRPPPSSLVSARLAGRSARHRRRPRSGRRPAAAVGRRPQPAMDRWRDHARRVAAPPVPPGDLERRHTGGQHKARARRPAGPAPERRPAR